jgi:hypothetical protein
MDDSGTEDTAHIERTSPRAVFAQLVGCALGKAEIEPSPMATAYLIELLDERVREPEPEPDSAPTLAEALLTAQQDRGTERMRRMRSLGDRALFVSGFFGDSLARKIVDIDYYMQIGRTAYGDVASGLSARATAASWTRLYRELAGRFGDFVDVLAEVGDRSRPERSQNLLRVYERYLLTGSERDRRRLIQNGHLPPDKRSLKWWQ